MAYDRALTVFSPDGHLFQVEYAGEAVRQGTTAVSIRAPGVITLGVEKKVMPKLQEERTVRKIVRLDKHVMMAFAGLSADARVLIDKARIECQSYQLSMEVPVTLAYVARYIASVQQSYTQRGGLRPFGLSVLVAGFDTDGTPNLYKTEPSGAFSAWKAAATGRNAKSMQEYLEKHYVDDLSDAAAVKLTVRSLLEVVDSGMIDVCVLRPGSDTLLTDAELAAIVAEIEADKKAEEAATAAAKPGA
eukprot:a676797_1804.p2 GENE.a676797_1804~~a676797_1804.p2  ORF type:complete len:256 (-),score=114.11 a676797_1804:42-779(-)